MVAFDMQDRSRKVSSTRCATNRAPMDARVTCGDDETATPLPTVLQRPWWRRLPTWRQLDLIVVYADMTVLLRVAAELLASRSTARLVGIDIRLTRPIGWRGRLHTELTRPLLRRVDRFILHQRDILTLDRLFGIGPRCAYLPSESEAWERLTQEMLREPRHVCR